MTSKLTPISDNIEINKWGRKCLMCLCVCGITKLVEIRHIKSGDVKTCGRPGCKASIKHGSCHTKIYHVWNGIKQRCINPTAKGYSDYGGRGIYIDPRWLSSFEEFIKDVGEPPGPNMQIDRIDNSRGYWSDNVRWATAQTQARNRRSNTVVEFRGLSKTLVEWCEEFDIRPGTVCERLKLGWSIERSLTTPTRKYGA